MPLGIDRSVIAAVAGNSAEKNIFVSACVVKSPDALDRLFICKYHKNGEHFLVQTKQITSFVSVAYFQSP